MCVLFYIRCLHASITLSEVKEMESSCIVNYYLFLHSTITTWGKSGEVKAFSNMLTKFSTGLVAVVSDSFDIFNACKTVWGDELRDLVISRGDKGGTLVIRPDSGDPPEIVVKVMCRIKFLGSRLPNAVLTSICDWGQYHGCFPRFTTSSTE